MQRCCFVGRHEHPRSGEHRLPDLARNHAELRSEHRPGRHGPRFRHGVTAGPCHAGRPGELGGRGGRSGRTGDFSRPAGRLRAVLLPHPGARPLLQERGDEHVRERRIQGANGTFQPDLNNGAAGLRDLPGFSGGNSTVANFTDTSAEYANPGGEVYEYRYSVAAKICNNSSPQFSNTVVYPGCNIVVAVAAVGSSSGDGSFATPFVLGYGDSITVTRSSGNLLAGVTFTLYLNGVAQGLPQS